MYARDKRDRKVKRDIYYLENSKLTELLTRKRYAL